MRKIFVCVIAVASVFVAGIAVGQNQRFHDVSRNHEFHDDVERVVAAGIMNGCGDGSDFCVEDNLKRGQAARVVSRLLSKIDDLDAKVRILSGQINSDLNNTTTTLATSTSSTSATTTTVGAATTTTVRATPRFGYSFRLDLQQGTQTGAIDSNGLPYYSWDYDYYICVWETGKRDTTEACKEILTTLHGELNTGDGSRSISGNPDHRFILTIQQARVTTRALNDDGFGFELRMTCYRQGNPYDCLNDD